MRSGDGLDDRRAIVRRRLLALGGLISVAVAVWLLLSGDGDVGPAEQQGAKVTEIEIQSEAVGETLPVSVVVPEGAKPGAPLLVFLHGRGSDEESSQSNEMFAALSELGGRTPIVAFPYGGEDSYWHDRADGDWSAYVRDEVIPEVAERFDADEERVAVGGISMGGYGAYNLAADDPGRFCAVGGHSPALWQTAGESAPGAFDDAEDFAEHDVIAAVEEEPDAFGRQPVWLDAGTEDPFLPGDDAFIAALKGAGADLTSERWPGGHDSDYWNSHWTEYLDFYSGALADCDLRTDSSKQS